MKDINYKYTTKQWVNWYEQKRTLMGEAYTEVTPEQFYRDLFPIGSLQERGNMDTDRGNALVDVISYYPNERQYTRKYVMTEDLVALRYMKPQGKTKELARMCLCSPVTYYGIHKSNDMAHELYAVVLDLDYVGVQQLKNVMKQIGNGARCVPPNYIVNSGRGLHFYYLLEEPIPCYKYMVEELTKFKAVLQDFIWNETSSLAPEKPDHGAITQAFRMVGSETKLGKDYVVRAYKVRDERWTVKELYEWVEERAASFLKGCPQPELREPIKVYRKRHPLTLEQAKKKYPDWQPNGEKGRWTCKPDLYHWWIRQIRDKAIVGGRYYSVLALAAYGSKCGIPLKQIEKDAMELLPFLESLTNDEKNHFTKADIRDALSFFKKNKKEVTYKLTRARISELSKITIQANKRNGRRQKDHVVVMNKMKEVKKLLGETVKEGRPVGSGTAESRVRDYRAEHPDASVTEVARALAISRPTVYKWWDAEVKTS